MTAVAMLRALTPLGWLAVGLVGLAVAALVLGGLGFRWDPLDLARRRADRAEASASIARSEAQVRAAEAQAQAGQVARLDSVLATTRRLDATTHRSTLHARAANDADLPLAPDRLDRLRAHDRELCRIAPGLGGCAAAPDPAGDGDPSL
ncbi:hypothetical protein [Brevundimonas aurifodinae]|uniref:Lysozyme n=2 Tax=Brevundimonas TaxID=41275 RepID=A0ABV1NPI5_9CAUL|nr:MAG: hypothetical protein B7Z42_00125 [Brevundimonas sp. 12-68-7]OYX35969.1 MAG: hypothetical protein B7Z01_01275 [Brevundimonas subvibrioides]